MNERVLNLSDLERIVEEKRREALKIVAYTRLIYGKGTGRRSIVDSLKLGFLAKSIVEDFIDTSEYSTSRVLRLKL